MTTNVIDAISKQYAGLKIQKYFLLDWRTSRYFLIAWQTILLNNINIIRQTKINLHIKQLKKESLNIGRF